MNRIPGQQVAGRSLGHVSARRTRLDTIEIMAFMRVSLGKRINRQWSHR
jgi:hypothetical protein